MILKKTNYSDKVLLVHNGAIGDFFMAWPAILALHTALPRATLFWAGKTTMLPWLDRLNIAPADAQLRRGLRSLYGTRQWPRELVGTDVVWFGLSAPCPCPQNEILFLPGIDKQFPDTPPRELYLSRLRGCGIETVGDWHRKFQTLFRSPHPTPGKQILLFPGSGHPAKNWGLVKFLELATRLADAGETPVFVLGPVERTQKMNCDPFPCHHPENLRDLEALLATARLVIGNDSGPMHLAGCLGTPGLALFGPTNHRQWGAPGITPLVADTPCRPCSATARISCTTPVCMNIPVETVFKECTVLLKGML